MKMSGTETRSGTAGKYVFDRTADRPQFGMSEEQSTAGVVHDLGNLIQVASSALNRVARDPSVSTAPALEPVISSARTALQRAGALVRETVGWAATSHRMSERSSVSACLAEVENLVQSTLEANIRLMVHVERDLPAAMCDPLGLQNAILNLVFNARDAMPNGGLISISAAAVVLDPGTAVELRVEDSGIGMTRETVLRAFDLFFTTKGTGLGGVGLPMVKHFAECHGGRVDIESAFGSGTTVILRLPAIEARQE
ncbi:ATP-binding protein [Mesorhizobium sp.]|uniref:sensor histidine kinase n=2 Tax=Mesorhizobium sp. TaxID=1871066 RepID=UPI00257D9350|nr:ATP-binding protein [Mesorhizobium sp.]